MWDDPLFNQDAPRPWIGEGLDDENSRTIRRDARLTALEVLYVRVRTLDQSVAKWKEAAGRHLWCAQQLLKVANLPLEKLESIKIEQQINAMDPDFSFARWAREYSNGKHRD